MESAAGPSGSWRALLIAAIEVVFLLGPSPDAEGRTRCSYAGAPANLLTVSVSGEVSAAIRRDGEEIVVLGARGRPRRCSGEVATVFNTDTIRVGLRGLFAFADLELGGGPFAPGATPEAQGAPEIEVEFRGEEAFSGVVGTAGIDEFRWGLVDGLFTGLNVNPASADDQDVDVTVKAVGFFGGVLIAYGAGGNDRILPAPGASFPSDVWAEGGRGADLLIAPRSGSDLAGGVGDDVLTGGRSYDKLDGGADSDRIDGGGGGDLIRGGLGRDLLSGGRGGDFMHDRDDKRDRIRCGPGRDGAKADRRDRLRDCEAIRRG